MDEWMMDKLSSLLCYENSWKSQKNWIASLTDECLVPLHTLQVIAVLSTVPVDREEKVKERKSQIWMEECTFPHSTLQSWLLNSPGYESVLPLNMQLAKLKCTVILFCLIRKYIKFGVYHVWAICFVKLIIGVYRVWAISFVKLIIKSTFFISFPIYLKPMI